MAFSALATKVYKDPITTVWANSIKDNDDFLYTASIKSWVNFDGSAAALSARASLNVASITDVGAGQWRVVFTTGFNTSGYVAMGVCARTGGTVTNALQIDSTGAGPTTGFCPIAVSDDGGALRDVSVIMVGFAGPLN